MRNEFARMSTLIVLCLLVTVASSYAQAQAAPVLTFTAETVTGVGSVVPKLTWSTTPAATSCVASGDTAWTGGKAAAGTVTLAATTSSKTYTLTCSWPGDTSAKLTWVAPTTNTDGSALTDLAGYRVKHGASSSALSTIVPVNSAATTTHTVTGLASGTRYFAVTAINAAGVESALSNIVSKTINATASINRTVGITVNPQPNPPANLTVE